MMNLFRILVFCGIGMFLPFLSVQGQTLPQTSGYAFDFLYFLSMLKGDKESTPLLKDLESSLPYPFTQF